MPQFLRLASFALACALGILSTYPLSLYSRLRQECSADAPAPTYNYNYQLPSIGYRVRHTRPAAGNPSRGRVAGLSAPADGEVFVAVRWELPPDNGAPGVRWYNYATYQKYIVAEVTPTCGF